MLFGSSTMALLNQTVWYKNPSTGLTSEYRVVAVRCDNYVTMSFWVTVSWLSSDVRDEGHTNDARQEDEGDEGQETGVVPVPTP